MKEGEGVWETFGSEASYFPHFCVGADAPWLGQAEQNRLEKHMDLRGQGVVYEDILENGRKLRSGSWLAGF